MPLLPLPKRYQAFAIAFMNSIIDLNTNLNQATFQSTYVELLKQNPKHEYSVHFHFAIILKHLNLITINGPTLDLVNPSNN